MSLLGGQRSGRESKRAIFTEREYTNEHSSDILFLTKGSGTVNIIEIGKLIAEARREKGLTQAQLGNRIGVEPHTVSMWETGRHLPDDGIKIALCQELDLLLEELFLARKFDAPFRKELLAMIKGEDTKKVVRMSDEGKVEEINLDDFLLVTAERKGHLSDLWIPWKDRDKYSEEEIYAMQDEYHRTGRSPV